MCGIAGIQFHDSSRRVDELTLLAMHRAITHRGPDDSGRFIGEGVGLASQRLSIIDLSENGHMPMFSPDGRYVIVYNGEVYNFLELRRELKAQGHRFRSDSDTEVILRLFEIHGPSMLDRLNGMFAFAIWDTVDRSLFLARDRFGVKPLYYADDDGALVFASEQKSLFAAGLSPQFDPETLEELICFRYVAGERTPFVGVKRLLPGHYAICRNGTLKTTRWWSLGERAIAHRENLPAITERWFEETFASAVGLRRISDVPVGILLSGGLDSSSVASELRPGKGERTSSFTVQFASHGRDEGPIAREVAARFGLDYNGLEMAADEVPALLREALLYNDEPLAHANAIPLLSISRLAKDRVSVLLSGEGGDELMGGYVRYQPLNFPSLLSVARPALGVSDALVSLPARWKKLHRFLNLGSLDRFVFFNSCDILPADLKPFGLETMGGLGFREQMLGEAKSIYPNEPIRQAMYYDQHTFLCSILDRNDRMTMGASIECRTPFLDYRLAETLAALPSTEFISARTGKKLLRRTIGKRLPKSVLTGPKWGFGVPYEHYMRSSDELRARVNDLPSAAPIRDSGINRLALRKTVHDFMSGDNRHTALLWQLTMISEWHEIFCSRSLSDLQTEIADLATARSGKLAHGQATNSPAATSAQ